MRLAETALAVLSVLLVPCAPARAGELFVVDAAGGGDFLDIQPAVDAARDGDSLLVLAGDYGPVRVAGKGISIVAHDPGTDVRVDGILVQDLDPGDRFFLAGLYSRGQTGHDPHPGRGFWASSCAGSVRVQECWLRGGTGAPPAGSGWAGAHVEACADVVFSDCRLEGGTSGGDAAERSGHGLHASASAVALYDSECRGRDGGLSSSVPPPDGGDGAHVLASELFASATSFQGGRGGDGSGFGAYPAGTGGDGLHLGEGSVGRALECEFAGGPGGESCAIACFDGPAGAPTTIESSTLELLPGSARTCRAFFAVNVGATVRFRFEGLPGDEVYLATQLETGHAFLPEESGVLVLAQPTLVPTLGDLGGGGGYPVPLELTSAFMGVIPDDGLLVRRVRLLPSWPPTVSALLFAQPSFRGALGEVVLGSPVTIQSRPCGLLAEDCDADGWPDPCETHAGRDDDCDRDGVPDACQTFVDCNQNGIADFCDVANGTSGDKNGNGIPDECDPGRIAYVDTSAPAGGNGTSWGDALRRLDDALDAARQTGSLIEEIWVAQGTYKPGALTSSTFELVPGVALYGGFAGGELELGQRDPALYRTLLSGDVQEDDGPGFTNYDDNNRHVVTFVDGPGPARLDGFVIQAGNAVSSSGGGLHVGGIAGPCVVVRCTFLRNQAWSDGGAVHAATALDVVSCAFAQNQVRSSGTGGALRVTADLRATNCTFVGNHATRGGAVHLQYISAPASTAEIVACTFFENVADEAGAGAAVHGWSLPSSAPDQLLLYDSILWRNRNADGATEPAQLFLDGMSVDIRYCDVQALDIHAGPGNLGLAPRFLDAQGPDGEAGTFDDDLRLLPVSPCIDAGRNALVPPDLADLDLDGDLLEPTPLDHDGLPRFVDDPAVPDTGSGGPPTVDMGAFERQRE